MLSYCLKCRKNTFIKKPKIVKSNKPGKRTDNVFVDLCDLW